MGCPKCGQSPVKCLNCQEIWATEPACYYVTPFGAIFPMWTEAKEATKEIMRDVDVRYADPADKGIRRADTLEEAMDLLPTCYKIMRQYTREPNGTLTQTGDVFYVMSGSTKVYRYADEVLADHLKIGSGRGYANIYATAEEWRAARAAMKAGCDAVHTIYGG